MALFEDLGDLLNPMSNDKIKDIQKTLTENLQRSILSDLMRCDTLSEVKEVERLNEPYFKMWGFLADALRVAKCRVTNITPAKIDAWGLSQLN